MDAEVFLFSILILFGAITLCAPALAFFAIANQYKPFLFTSAICIFFFSAVPSYSAEVLLQASLIFLPALIIKVIAIELHKKGQVKVAFFLPLLGLLGPFTYIIFFLR